MGEEPGADQLHYHSSLEDQSLNRELEGVRRFPPIRARPREMREAGARQHWGQP
jgi:hypothetical protein